MKILITGGAGFIGSHVVEALQTEHEIVIIDDFNDYYSPTYKRENVALLQPITVYEADITNIEALDTVFKEHTFDCIIHLAARAGVRPSITNPHIYTEVNVVGTTNILQAAVRYSVPRIILGSTSAVYGNSSPVPFTETVEVSRPISPYAASKRSAELMAYTFHHLYQIKTTVLRFFTVYGERGRPDMAPYLFTKALLTNQPIKKFGDGTTSRDYTYVKDIVAGVVAALEHPQDFATINLGNNYPVSLNEFIATLESITGQVATIDQQPMQPGDVEKTWANIDLAKQLLNWEPQTSLHNGLEKFVAWFRSHRL